MADPARSVLHVVPIPPLVIDLARRSAQVDGEVVLLGRQLLLLLATLASEPERVFTKRELLRDLWGYEVEGRTRTLDSHACRLRTIIGKRWVVNRHGQGYSLCRPGDGGSVTVLGEPLPLPREDQAATRRDATVMLAAGARQMAQSLRHQAMLLEQMAALAEKP